MSDMYTCDLCGKPTPNFTPWTCGPIAGKIGRSWCDDCEERFERELALEDEQSEEGDIDRDELLDIAEDLDCGWAQFNDDTIACEDVDKFERELAARIRKAVGE